MNAETVIAEYQSSLRAFLLSRMRNPSEVDDILQDVLIKTFQNLHSLKSEDKIKPWLFQIARNAMMDHYRSKSRDASVSQDDLWYDEPNEAAVHAFEGCVEAFLFALPSEAGDLLREVDLHGVSQKEYAERLGISYSTLKSRVQASRKQLRQLFDQCCDIAFAAEGSVLDYTRNSPGCDRC
ncbi:RNA polymerase sigma factor SigZ [Pseudophaeobacter sp.]|uniref:RNA polymerase sigma factor SigZ n=1 Tax=Pseudophaeobacter sp. TaxID=1971739 RepID=UPI0040599ED6